MAVTQIPTFGLTDRLRKARHMTGLSQADFAALLDVSVDTVKRMENGTHRIQRVTVYGWAVAAGVDPSWLLTGQIDNDDASPVTEPVFHGYLSWHHPPPCLAA